VKLSNNVPDYTQQYPNRYSKKRTSPPSPSPIGHEDVRVTPISTGTATNQQTTTAETNKQSWEQTKSSKRKWELIKTTDHMSINPDNYATRYGKTYGMMNY